MKYRRSDKYFRKVRKDEHGLFVLWECKVFRPQQPSKHQEGDRILVEENSWDHGKVIRVCDGPAFMQWRDEKWGVSEAH